METTSDDRKFYTSYYGNLRNIPSKFNLISVSNSIPVYLRGIVTAKFFLVVPEWDLVTAYKKGLVTESDYVKKYLSILDRRNEDSSIINYINSLADCSVFLCYEKSDSFCHRHVLSLWMKDKYNLDCSEYK